MPKTKIFILPNERKRCLDCKSSTFHRNTYVFMFMQRMEDSRAASQSFIDILQRILSRNGQLFSLTHSSKMHAVSCDDEMMI